MLLNKINFNNIKNCEHLLSILRDMKIEYKELRLSGDCVGETDHISLLRRTHIMAHEFVDEFLVCTKKRYEFLSLSGIVWVVLWNETHKIENHTKHALILVKAVSLL